MNGFTCPKLRNLRTGAEIEINSNPFSIGRGLSCNYVLPNKTVSRVHCVLKVNEGSAWILKDSSTNGTYINSKVVKHVESEPLKNNDVISFELEGVDSYTFLSGNTSDDISDEQLCAIADTVINQMELLTSNPLVVASSAQVGGTSMTLRSSASNSQTNNPLLDHMYSTKSADEGTKRPRMGRSPRPILGMGSRRNSASAPAPPLVEETNLPPYEAGLLRIVESATFVNAPVVNENDEGRLGVSGTNNLDGASCSREGASGVAAASGDGGRKEDSEETCTDSSGSSNDKNLNGAKANPMQQPQPGPSTDKSDRPPEQQVNYEVMENELQCVICSELFIKSVTLNCSHTFCKLCISMWNKNKSDCPICRTKISSMNSSIVVDNVVEKMIESSNDEIRQHRKMVLEERKKQEEAENKPPKKRHAEQPAPARNRGRGRGRGRSRTAPRVNRAYPDPPPRINVLDPLSINIGALASNVIEVSSDSSSSSTSGGLTSDTDELNEEYDADDWYTMPRRFFGGYGHCYRCGSPNHWANSCPNR